MDYDHDKSRMIAAGDRLSNLPDDLIHRILSFIGIKQAIETSVLSSRWRYIWTSMPFLNFSSQNFISLLKFTKFVMHVMTKRNNQIEVSSFKLTLHGNLSHKFIREVLSQFCQNLQHFSITCLPEKTIQVPLYLFNPQSIKRLALRTFYFDRVTLNASSGDCLFSNFPNLKNLTIKSCIMSGASNGFNICHPGLLSLRLEDGCQGVSVVTPQLKNLTIKDWQSIHPISAPNLSSLHYKNNDYLLEFSADLLYMDKVDICISYPVENKAVAHKIVRLFQQLRSVKFLTLNMEIIKVLSSFIEIISHQPSPFANLKSVKIYPSNVTPEEQTHSDIIT